MIRTDIPYFQIKTHIFDHSHIYVSLYTFKSWKQKEKKIEHQ